MSAAGRRAPKSLILQLLVAFAAVAGSAPAPGGTRSIVVLAAAAPGRIELASGEAVDLGLPAGARLEAALPLATGWIAAATRPAGAGREMLLLARLDSTAAATALPVPPASAPLRAEPLPLVEDGRLAGLVWLEGDSPRRLAVRAARWSGAAWEAPRTVSPPGPGSQLALAAARLADGSWLLAWSAFDGHHDEILWSRSAGAAWSPPARVAPDRGVPEITPALAATAGGALLAWSRFDGAGYQAVVARFSPAAGGSFSPPRPLAVAAAGAVFPSFEAVPEGTVAARLLLRTAVPAGWSLVELDESGRALRRASLADPAEGSPPGAGAGDRPVVEAAAGAAVTFRFPARGERRTAAWEAAPRAGQP